MRALLDINVVIALLDAGWASCPVTQNDVLRILSQPAFPNHKPVAEVAERLAEACSLRPS